MKTKTPASLIALALSATSQAGETYSAKSSKAIIPPPPAPECRLQWFLGASAGYLTDASEEMYHLQFGIEKKCEYHSHALYLEVGFTSLEENFEFLVGDNPASFDVDTDIIPITLNYKYERNINQNLSWYVGVGAGIALVDTDADISTIAATTSQSFDDTAFYAQAFAGLIYEFTPQFEMFGGARYIYMDEPDFAAGTSNFDIDGDVLIELGARYTF